MATPDAVAPPPRHPRFPLIDGVRAIAALTVLTSHVVLLSLAADSFGYRLLTHLNVGVTIFFVLSGFLLYRPFIAHRRRGPAAPGFRDYARRRALRILPAYWLALTVLTALPGVVGVSGGDWLSQYALLHTFSFTQGPDSCEHAILSCGMAQTWSLAVEATFYVALPLYVLTSERLARGGRSKGWVPRELGVLAVLSAISVSLHFSHVGPLPSTVVDGSLLAFFIWFALGMALAVLSVAAAGAERRPRPLAMVAEHPGAVWLAAIGVYVVACRLLPPTPFIFDRTQQLGAHLAFGLVALLVVLPAVFSDGRAGVPGRILSNRIVRWLGLISYGIFLWHYAVTVELGSPGHGWAFAPLLLATLTISVACAAASYYAVERPLLKLK